MGRVRDGEDVGSSPTRSTWGYVGFDVTEDRTRSGGGTGFDSRVLHGVYGVEVSARRTVTPEVVGSSPREHPKDVVSDRFAQLPVKQSHSCTGGSNPLTSTRRVT